MMYIWNDNSISILVKMSRYLELKEDVPQQFHLEPSLSGRLVCTSTKMLSRSDFSLLDATFHHQRVREERDGFHD